MTTSYRSLQMICLAVNVGRAKAKNAVITRWVQVCSTACLLEVTLYALAFGGFLLFSTFNV